MSTPPPYERATSFTDWSTNHPEEPHRGQDLDEEFDAISGAITGTQANLAQIQREDGELANESVGPDQLSPEALEFLETALPVVGPEGPPGPQLPGPPGVAGPAGWPMPWIVGTGVPPYTIGAEGQLYLNADNGDVYQRSDVAWLLTGNIRGPEGVPGEGTGGVTDHGALTGLNDPDHPIAAISGLQGELDALSAAISYAVGTQTRTYAQPQQPTGAVNAGDLWIDTSQQNRLKRYNGVNWIDVADARIATAAIDAANAIELAAGAQATADGKVTTFVSAQQPTAEGVGDLWIDQANKNVLKRWSGSQWTLVRDIGITDAINAAATAQTTADGKIVTFWQTTMPVGGKVGDLWVDTDDGNHLYRHNGATFISIRDAQIAAASVVAAEALQKAASAEAIADGKIDVFYQGTAPVGAAEGDLWIDTDDNQLYRWSASLVQWVSVQDQGITDALTAAGLAQASADGKIVTFYSTTAPTSAAEGDLWIDTDDAKRPYRRTSGAWVDITPIADVANGQVGVKGIASGAVMQVKSYGGFSTGTSIRFPGVSAAVLLDNSNLDFVVGQDADGASAQQFLIEVNVAIMSATWAQFADTASMPDGPPPRFRVQLWDVTGNAQADAKDTLPMRIRNTQMPPGPVPVLAGTRYEHLSFSMLFSIGPGSPIAMPATSRTYRFKLLGYTDQNVDDVNALFAYAPRMTVTRFRR